MFSRADMAFEPHVVHSLCEEFKKKNEQWKDEASLFRAGPSMDESRNVLERINNLYVELYIRDCHPFSLILFAASHISLSY
jgi:hypothetical protein